MPPTTPPMKRTRSLRRLVVPAKQFGRQWNPPLKPGATHLRSPRGLWIVDYWNRTLLHCAVSPLSSNDSGPKMARLFASTDVLHSLPKGHSGYVSLGSGNRIVRVLHDAFCRAPSEFRPRVIFTSLLPPGWKTSLRNDGSMASAAAAERNRATFQNDSRPLPIPGSVACPGPSQSGGHAKID